MQPVAREPEELASALSHAAGVAASVAGGAVLVSLAARDGDVSKIVGAAVFAASLVLLYSASTLYHFAWQTNFRSRLRILDHCAIFVLIAATYTPFVLLGLRGAWRWALLATIWVLAAGGVGFKLFFTGRFRLISTLLYLGMGWLAVAAAGPMLRGIAMPVLLWLLAGGLIYTMGTGFYHNRRMPYAHAVWHLFVLGGSACHYVAVLLQILPGQPL